MTAGEICSSPESSRSSISASVAPGTAVKIQPNLIEIRIARVNAGAKLQAQHAGLPFEPQRRVVQSQFLPDARLRISGPRQQHCGRLAGFRIDRVRKNGVAEDLQRWMIGPEPDGCC